MKNRIAFVFASSILTIAILLAVILNQYSTSLPAAGQQVLRAYIQSNYPDDPVTTIRFAQHRERFTADTARPLIDAQDSEYLISPVLYDGEIIRPPEEKGQFPFPAQELWCVTLTQNNQTAEYLFLGRHDTLYEENWVLYQSQSGAESQQTVGCVSP